MVTFIQLNYVNILKGMSNALMVIIARKLTIEWSNSINLINIKLNSALFTLPIYKDVIMEHSVPLLIGTL